ncbi:MAG: hypothetical protein IJ828_04195 [Treponema sp.]|nr:hypothetical protein [Treponema sp.]
MKHYFLYLFSAACLCAALLGCSSPVMGDEESVFVSVAEPALPLASAWHIVYGSDFGTQQDFIATDLKAGFIELKKNAPSYILAYPLAENGQVLGYPHDTVHPYGAISPYSTILCPQDGFAASILQELYCTCEKTDVLTYNIQHFNWQKFMELCRDYETPWLINRNKVLVAIKKGKFKKTDIKIDVKKK